MKGRRALVAIVVLVAWAVFVPLATASSDCAAMILMCDGACRGASIASPPTAPERTELVAAVHQAPMSARPSIANAVLEPPPE